MAEALSQAPELSTLQSTLHENDMGNLLQAGLQRRVTLDARVLVGRSPKCDLQLRHPSISGEHAILQWNGHTWGVRDLGSRNGTRVNGAPVDPSAGQVLVAGDALQFGHYPVEWTLESDAAPEARAVCAESGETLRLEAGVLTLPSLDAPEAIVYPDPLRGWVFESLHEERGVEDLETLTVAGRSWRLHLPVEHAETLGPQSFAPCLAEVALVFGVSADEEHVQLEATVGQAVVDLGSRAHTYALLTLARLRMRDAADPDLAAAEHGWVYQEELLRMLRLTRTQLNLQVFRARKQFEDLAVQDGRTIIERRPDSRQLRLGTGLLTEKQA